MPHSQRRSTPTSSSTSSMPARPRRLTRLKTVHEGLRSLKCDSKETWVVFNKCDAIHTGDWGGRLATSRGAFSARTGRSPSPRSRARARHPARRWLERLRREDEEVEILVPHSRSDV